MIALKELSLNVAISKLLARNGIDLIYEFFDHLMKDIFFGQSL